MIVLLGGDFVMEFNVGEFVMAFLVGTSPRRLPSVMGAPAYSSSS